MLAALDTELWPPGQVSTILAGSLVTSDGFESLVTTFWWMCTIASEYKKHGLAEKTNETGSDWKADWIEGLGYCCQVWRSVSPERIKPISRLAQLSIPLSCCSTARLTETRAENPKLHHIDRQKRYSRLDSSISV